MPLTKLTWQDDWVELVRWNGQSRASMKSNWGQVILWIVKEKNYSFPVRPTLFLNNLHLPSYQRIAGFKASTTKFSRRIFQEIYDLGFPTCSKNIQERLAVFLKGKFLPGESCSEILLHPASFWGERVLVSCNNPFPTLILQVVLGSSDC